ncbi:MAG: hypothetical protein HKL80_05835 [Acidimicrobiales bacterium]|nr:hypothetical protein [Acidimicrobiales bacterium]
MASRATTWAFCRELQLEEALEADSTTVAKVGRSTTRSRTKATLGCHRSRLIFLGGTFLGAGTSSIRFADNSDTCGESVTVIDIR